MDNSARLKTQLAISLAWAVLGHHLTAAAPDEGARRLWFDEPATGFEASLPLGNGRIGAMVFGGIQSERIVLNESSMWSGSPQEADRREAYKILPEIRRLLLEGKNAEAEKLVNANFTCQGPGSGNGNGANVPFGCYQVLGDLRLQFATGVPVREPMCPSGHRAYFENQEVRFSADGNPDTKWCVIHQGRPVQWQIDAGKDVRPRRYQFTSAEDVPGRDPRTWKLEGSVNGKSWRLLDARTNQPAFERRRQQKSYNIREPSFCRYLRFTFEPNPGLEHFQIAEIQVEGVETGSKADMKGTTRYRRELTLSDGIARVAYEREGVKFERAHLVSAPDQVFAMKLTSSRKGALGFELALDRPERFTTSCEAPNELLMTGGLSDGRGGTGVRYAARARVLALGGSAVAAGNRILVSGADEALLLVSAATDYRGFTGRQVRDPLLVSRNDIDRATLRGWKNLVVDHTREYKSWFDRAELSLPATINSALPTNRRLISFVQGAPDPALAALYFNYGRYLLISSSRPDGLPANLQGIWAQEIQTPWNGDWHLDINVQMNYWPAEVCNLPELHEPMHRLIASLTQPGAKTAKAYYDARGWVAHVITNPWGYTSPGESASWGATVSGSAWLCQHLWEHYAFTLDREYLKWAYPILKGACEFYLDNLVEEPRRKWLVTGPSNSPENAFRLPNAQSVHVCLGPTIDMQLLRELFGNTAQAAEILGIDPEFGRQLRDRRGLLAPNQIGPDGRLQEWLEPYPEPEPAHRHTSPMYGLHPGYEITRRGTPELAAACRKFLEARGDDSTGWALAWRMNLWARLGDGDRAHKLLAMLLRPAGNGSGSLPNLFDSCPPFQIDGNFGGCAGIAEMLLQSHAGEIELLPALAGAWPNGSVKGLKARGGFAVDMTWKERRLVSATLQSNAGTNVVVRLGERTARLTLRPGEKREISNLLDGK